MTILGRDEQGSIVSLSLHDRLTSMYVLGKTGTGKSTLIENMVVEDITAGIGLCLIEPHRDLTEYIINRISWEKINSGNIILLDPLDEKAFGLNIFDCPDITDPVMVGYTLNSVMDIFEKLYEMTRSTPQMAQTMRNLTLLLIHNPGMTLLEIPQILTDKTFRNRLVSRVPVRYQSFWKRFDSLSPHDQDDLTRSTANKIDEFINEPVGYYIFGQSKTSINFREIMDSGKTILISLATDFPQLTSLLGSILISQMLLSGLSRKNVTEKKRRQFNLFIDEFQNFATPSINKLLTESRKYKLASCVAHQTRNQINEVIRSTTLNVGSLVCFQLTSEDAEELSAEFNFTPQKLPINIPRNCLEYIDRHQNEVVKQFAADYIHKLNEASKLKKQEDRDFITHPHFDFGEGEVTFHEEWIPLALRHLQTLFYEQMTTGYVMTSNLRKAVWSMAPLLRFNHLQTDEHEKYYKEEAPRYTNFGHRIAEVLKVLDVEKIEATPTVITPHQNYADRKNQIANELVQMPKFHAHIKIPQTVFEGTNAKHTTKECVIETILPQTDKKDAAAKRRHIRDFTRATYCKSRAEVEEDIQRRQSGNDDPPPSLTRKHKV